MEHFFIRLAFILGIHPEAPVDQAIHATMAATETVPGRVTVAQGAEETRWRTGLVSRAKGGWFCGVLQLQARGRADCHRIDRDVAGSYRGAVEHLQRWLDFCSSIKRPGLKCALAGYGGGVRAARGRYPNGRAERYAERVLRRAGL